MELLYFMDTFYDSMQEMSVHDASSKIFLCSMILSKFRNEDIELKGTEKFKNLAHFLEHITLHPTPIEMHQAKRWDKLKKEGTLTAEIDRPQKSMSMGISNADFNSIRAKAIEFGSAVDPQMARNVKPQMDAAAKREQIKREIGGAVDTKALQSTLAKALQHRLGGGSGGGSSGIEEKKEDDLNGDESNGLNLSTSNGLNASNDLDFTKWTKMISMGIPMEAVIRDMTQNGVSQNERDRFMERYGGAVNAALAAPVQSSAIMQNGRSALMNAIQARGGASAMAIAPVPGIFLVENLKNFENL